ncbi:MAG: septum formation initiator family protein [Pseudomonadota bacterium]
MKGERGGFDDGIDDFNVFILWCGMNAKQVFLMVAAVAGIFSLSLLIVYGNNGLMDLVRLREEKGQLVEKNEAIRQENVSLYREIDRMNHDPDYIEEVARKELGVIGPGEVIIRMKDDRDKRK